MKLIKTLLTILFISLLSSPSWSVSSDDLVFRDGLYYQKFTDVPFTGEVSGWEQGVINNGKRDGAWVWYHENGQLWVKGNYKNGQREGAWFFYEPNGTVMELHTGTYKDGYKISD